MDIILNQIYNKSIFDEHFNFKNDIQHLIIDDVEYNTIINTIKKDNNSIIYIGQLNNDEIIGNGIMIIDNFIFVRGNFQTKNKITSCEIFVNNNLFYKGNLINGFLNGQSIFYLNNKIIFKGILENNIINDTNCLFIYSNNNEYQGTIINNTLEGMGTFKNSEGTYKGEFVNNERHGNGILYLENISYEGKWIHNKKNKIFKITENSIVRFIEYDNDNIIKEYSHDEYIIKHLNEKIINIKKQHLDDMNILKNQHKFKINEIRTICDEQLINQEQQFSKKIEEANNNKMCKICFSRPSNIVFDVCSHVVICDQCEIHLRRTSRLNKCPVCRTTYHRAKKAYFS